MGCTAAGKQGRNIRRGIPAIAFIGRNTVNYSTERRGEAEGFRLLQKLNRVFEENPSKDQIESVLVMSSGMSGDKIWSYRMYKENGKYFAHLKQLLSAYLTENEI